jgi:hypothetical protein
MDPEPEVHSFSNLEAQYTNYLQVGSGPHEMILEFGQYHNGEEAPRIHTRLVTHPAYIEEFIRVLAQALDQHNGGIGGNPEPASKRPQ